MLRAWLLLVALVVCCGLVQVAAAQDPVEDEAVEVEIEDDELEFDLDDDEFDLGDEEIDLGEAEVVGESAATTEAPAAAVTKVITAEEIDKSGVESVDELLMRVAGFTVNDSFAGSSVSYQGLPAKFTTVLVDGQRVPGHLFERVDFGQLPLSNIDRVEIIRGPQAAAYGSDNAGVIVNLVTKQPKGFGGNVALGVGSLGFNRQQMQVQGLWGLGNWFLGVERKERDAYDLEPTFPDTSGDGYEQYDIFFKVRQPIEKDMFSVQFDWYQEDGQGFSYSPPDQLRSNETLSRRFSSALQYEMELGGNQSLDFAVNYGTYYHDFYRYWIGFEEQTAIDTFFKDEILDTHLTYKSYGEDYIYTVGAERNWDSLESDRVSGNSENEATINAGYVMGEWFPHPDWSYTLAFRIDEHDEFGSELSPKGTLTHHFNKEAELSFAVGEGYRSPSLRERYFEFASPFGYSIIGNEDLDPETSSSFSLDYQRTTPSGFFRLGGFRHEVSDLIVFTEIQQSPQIFQTQNVDDARTTGLEFSAERRWKTNRKIFARSEPGEFDIHTGKCAELPCNFWDTVGVSYDLTWIADSEDVEFGTRLPDSPEWDHRMRFFYTADKFDTEVLLRYTDSRFLDRSNNIEAPDYTTVDVTYRRQLGGGMLKLAGMNVFDTANGRYGPEPGQEFRVEYAFGF